MAKPISERVKDLEKANEKLQSDLNKVHLDAETRAAALQYMLAQALRQLYLLHNLSNSDVKIHHEKAREMFRKYVHDGTSDPAMNDHISAEIEECLSDILNDIEDLREDYQKIGQAG